MELEDRVRRVLAIGETRSVGSLARSLRATVAEIAECANYSSGLDLTVGIRTGGGYAELPKSRWEIERYE